jgi:hypothetical protein
VIYYKEPGARDPAKRHLATLGPDVKAWFGLTQNTPILSVIFLILNFILLPEHPHPMEGISFATIKVFEMMLRTHITSH